MFSKRKITSTSLGSCSTSQRSPVKTRCSSLSNPTASHFIIDKCCLFCGHVIAKYDEFIVVRSLIFQESIRNICVSRNDSWAIVVLSRIESIIDIPAAGGVYHPLCSSNFRTGKDLPSKYSSSPKRRLIGRPVDEEKSQVFLKVIDWFENSEDEQVTIAMMEEK